jgi:hypothetical protein
MLVCSSIDTRYLLKRTMKIAIWRPVRGRGSVVLRKQVSFRRGIWSLTKDLRQRRAFQVRDEIEVRIGCEDGAVVSKRDDCDCKVGQC